METDKNYFLVGIFVIVIILAGFGFTLWLTSAGKGKTVDYRIHFSESVGGLKVGSMVKFHGVDVGNVKQMMIDPENINLTQVDIGILATTPIKTDTTATLEFLGISGDTYVELTGASEGAPNMPGAANDHSPPEIRAIPSNLSVVMDRLPQIADKADHLLEKLNHTADQINKIFNDQNVQAVNGLVRKLSGHSGNPQNQENPPPNQQR